MADSRVKVTFFAGLEQINLPKIIGKGERFLDKYYVTNDKKVINDLIHDFKNFIGSVEFGWLTRNSSALIYRSEEKYFKKNEEKTRYLEEQIIKDLIAIKALLFNLWTIKDNACEENGAWLVLHDSFVIDVHTNHWSGRYSTADGDYRIVDFSTDELKDARLASVAVGEHIDVSNTKTMLHAKSGRIGRFTYFLDAARQNRDIAVKILHYCSALEAIVSTSHTEISHQISERIAFLLRGRFESRLAESAGVVFENRSGANSMFVSTGSAENRIRWPDRRGFKTDSKPCW
jgi:hypothetical protein